MTAELRLHIHHAWAIAAHSRTSVMSVRMVSHPVCFGATGRAAASHGHCHCRHRARCHDMRSGGLMCFPVTDPALQPPRVYPGTSLSRVQCLSSPARNEPGGACVARAEQSPRLLPPSPTEHSTAAAHDVALSMQDVLRSAQPLQWPVSFANDALDSGGVPSPEQWHQHPALLSGCAPAQCSAWRPSVPRAMPDTTVKAPLHESGGVQAAMRS